VLARAGGSEKQQLTFAFALPNRTTAASKDADKERQNGDKEAKACGVDGPRAIKRKPDKECDGENEETA
jgi:hypothetical protein